jgi:predicted transglutaminase-like cysteine proteinase
MVLLLQVIDPAQAGLADKWRHSQSYDHGVLRADSRFQMVVGEAQGASRLQKISRLNRMVNRAILSTPDEVDYWATPVETFATGRGDCEDYATAKMAALAAVGIRSTLLVVRTSDGTHHAVLAVTANRRRRVLDNLTDKMALRPIGQLIARFYPR